MDKKGKTKLNEIICFECKELGHLKSEYPKLKKSSRKKAPKKKVMMAIWKDLDKDQEGTESQEEEEIVANLCFMVDIVSNEEIDVMDFEPKPSYDDLKKAYDELLRDSQTLSFHYSFLKKSFQKIVS